MKRPLQYWQKIYLASLALFLGGLCAGFFAVLNISCRQSFAARTGELLAGQHNLAVTLANDMAVVMASRPEALDLLWQETGRAARSEGLALAVWRGGAPRYSLLAMNDLPELETLQPGQRSWQVRLVEGRHLFFATTALAGDLTGYAVTVQADMEDFYTEWRRTGAVFLSLGSAVGAAFAAGLYLVLRRMNRPLQALTETARALAAGDYARRAAAPGAPPRRDEVGELARVLDQLAGRVQAQLRQLAEEAAAKQRLVDDLSHEMRTPLTAIGGYAEYLQLADVQGEERQEALQTIRHESRRLLNLSDQLVRLAVLRQEPLETARLDPAALLRRAAATARPKAESQGVSVQLRPLPGALPAIRGDGALLESLLVNLCDNGIKACATGGRVTLWAEENPAGGCTLAVADDGRGMDADTLRRIGQPFYRADKARSRAEGGAGLGVALCRSIAAAHGAALRYESAPGAGTTARVDFPPEGEFRPAAPAAFTTLQQPGDDPVTPAG